MMRVICFTKSEEAAQQMQTALHAKFWEQVVEILPFNTFHEGMERQGFILKTHARLELVHAMKNWIDGWWTAFSAATALANVLNDATKPDLRLAKS